MRDVPLIGVGRDVGSGQIKLSLCVRLSKNALCLSEQMPHQRMR